jgi:hypothetical protein
MKDRAHKTHLKMISPFIDQNFPAACSNRSRKLTDVWDNVDCKLCLKIISEFKKRHRISESPPSVQPLLESDQVAR